MKKRAGQATAHLDAPPDRVFGIVVDERNLPSWNGRMIAVIDAPHDPVEGTEWVVRMKVLGRRFDSRSHVIELDRQERRLVYRSKLEGDNPSFTIWTWEVEADGDGSRVTLGWELRPVTFVRKRLVSPLRHRLIGRTQAPTSLAALAKTAVAETTAD